MQAHICLELARTIFLYSVRWCAFGIFGMDIIKYTVIYCRSSITLEINNHFWQKKNIKFYVALTN